MASKQNMGRYAARGVSAGKEEVHAAVDKLDQGVFKGAFCKITEDYLTGSKSKCNVIHSDGSGTKSIIAYLHFKETGDASVFRGISQDSIVMNIDDLLCIGAVERILLSNTVNRNAKNFTGAALAELINRFGRFSGKIAEARPENLFGRRRNCRCRRPYGRGCRGQLRGCGYEPQKGGYGREHKAESRNRRPFFGGQSHLRRL